MKSRDLLTVHRKTNDKIMLALWLDRSERDYRTTDGIIEDPYDD